MKPNILGCLSLVLHCILIVYIILGWLSLVLHCILIVYITMFSLTFERFLHWSCRTVFEVARKVCHYLMYFTDGFILSMGVNYTH